MPARSERTEVTTEVDGRRLVLSNLEKVLYPEIGLTKGEVIDYYLRIAPVMLPHLADKALTRVRFPDGVAPGSVTFYEKNKPNGCPDWVRTMPVSTGDGIVDYLVATEVATLVYLANLAALELHVPQWHGDSAAERPITVRGTGDSPSEPLSDTVVIDLDPGEGLSADRLAHAAQLVGGLLATDGLLPLVKTTGSKGLQVYAAIEPAPARAVTAYAQSLGALLARTEPDYFVGTITVAERTGRVYLDHNQNLAARNTIAPYSLRGRAWAGVSTPLEWDEVAAVGTPQDLQFTPAQVLQRVDEHGDLFAELLDPADAPPLPDRADRR
ncbi:ATP-dependent DNA ligase [Enemella evansiae]|uniref:non-homologous end-joining DNA ligase n=1 Tax=Enemella evansiae TaxID=2016499 RepID=UPI000B96FA51|nr:non-homologous end-joining DNA ligase [Enemella evansiae]OYO12557.1 ATP-dependent DNA ligase [Enemella evansiae]